MYTIMSVHFGDDLEGYGHVFFSHENHNSFGHSIQREENFNQSYALICTFFSGKLK